ncbi:hypothetical protein D3C80_2171530 [compost metagenome]
MNQQSMKIDWVGFVDEARKNEWWDFQTLEVVENALVDALIPRNIVTGILTGIKHYMFNNRHPAMEQK